MLKSNDNRIFGLDLLRMLAIMSVVMGHGLPMLEAAKTEFPWIPMGDGVEMFFVLSGYLIGGILISSFVVEGKLGLKSLGRFLMRRWFRTLPNYYLVLGLNILFVYLGWNLGVWDFISAKFFYFSQNLAWPFQGFFWESWSLAVEEWFYLTFPTMLLLLFIISEKASVRKWLFLAGIAIFLVVPFVLRCIQFSPTLDHYNWDIGLRKVVIYRLDAIALGLLMVWIARYAPKFWKQARWPMFILGFWMFIFLSYYRQPVGTLYTQVWVFLLNPLAYALWLPLLSQIISAPKWLQNPIRHISLVSYSMYLIHFGLVLDLFMKWAKPTSGGMAWLTYLAYLGVVIGISTIMYYAWEKPMMNLRDKL